MDGFVRGIGDAFAGLTVGILSAVGHAIEGVAGALGGVIPVDLLPFVGIGVFVLVVVALVLRR